MNAVPRWFAAVLLTASMFAQSSPPANSPSPTTSSPRTSGKKKAAPRPAVSAEVEELKQALAAQQQQIQSQQQLLEKLQQELQSRDQASQQAVQQAQSQASAAEQRAAGAETEAAQQKDSVAKLQGDLADVKSNFVASQKQEKDSVNRLAAVEGLLGRFRFTGDVRLRGEDYFQTGLVDRNRARVRARFGVEGALNEDFNGGIFLATGSLGDPTTTNETFTNFFDRKTIGLDRGYITYNPQNAKWLQLTGGKFAFTWNRTSRTFDPDINPEGFSEKLNFDLSNPVLKNFAFTGMQLLFNENSKGADSYAVGGQISSKLALGNRISVNPSFTLLNWRNVDAILQASAFAVQATTTGTPSGADNPVTGLTVPGEGPGCATAKDLPAIPPCAFAANGMTNATFLDSKGVPHFRSGFLYADLILDTQFKTGLEKLPFNLVLEYEDNLNAVSDPQPGVGTQGKAYGVDASFGQTKNKHDFQVGYGYYRQEQDSILASFAESDQRAPTNILQNRIYGLYKLKKNITAAYTLWLGRTLNSNLQHAALVSGVKPGQVEPDLKRMQFDLIYTF